MHTVAHLQKRLKEFDAAGRGGADAAALKATWGKLFESAGMPTESAKSFERYYKSLKMAKKQQKGGATAKARREGGKKKQKRVLTLKRKEGGARSTRRAMRGGAAVALSGAPLSYGGAAPGLPLATYGGFITDFSKDGGALGAMPLTRPEMSIPQSAPGYWPTVPADMGSNQLPQAGGGTRRRRGQRGGSLWSSLSMRAIGGVPYMSSVPPNTLQTAGAAGMAEAPFASGRPEAAAWSTQAGVGAPLINPGAVTSIPSMAASLANPSPWQTAV
jgi:hypothetical protein